MMLSVSIHRKQKSFFPIVASGVSLIPLPESCTSGAGIRVRLQLSWRQEVEGLTYKLCETRCCLKAGYPSKCLEQAVCPRGVHACAEGTCLVRIWMLKLWLDPRFLPTSKLSASERRQGTLHLQYPGWMCVLPGLDETSGKFFPRLV